MRKSGEKRDLLPGTLEVLILKTLARERLHGYAIAQRIRQRSDEVLQVEEGSLYPALQRLLLKGLVASEWATSESGRRARFYELTAEGRALLSQEIVHVGRLLEAIQRVLLAE